MTISSEYTPQQYIGNGVTTVFSFPYVFYNNTDLIVTRTVISTGVDTILVLGSDYTVSGGSGSVGFITTTVAPTSAQRLTIQRSIPYKQEDNFEENTAFPAQTLETSLDKAVIMAQQNKEVVSRALVIPASDSGVNTTIPTAAVRAGKALFFDGSGNPDVTTDVDTVSAAAAAASASLAQAAQTAAEAAQAAAEAASAGIKWRPSVVAATTANITLSGEQTIDGKACITGDRVLVKNQSTTTQNGVYVVAAGAWSRATDADTWDELVSQAVTVNEGSTQADIQWICSSDPGGTLGVTAVSWASFLTNPRDGSVTLAKLDPAIVAASKLIGRGSSGNVTEISPGSGLSISGTTLLATPSLLTPQATTSGTTKDFTIPSGAKRVSVMFKNVSTNGTSNYLVQLGDAGGIETSGYNGIMVASSTGGGVGGGISSVGFPIYNALAASQTFGTLHLTLENASTFTWTADGVFYNYDGGTGRVAPVSGEKSLSQELTTIRITSASADTFDAGEVNVMWE